MLLLAIEGFGCYVNAEPYQVYFTDCDYHYKETSRAVCEMESAELPDCTCSAASLEALKKKICQLFWRVEFTFLGCTLK